MPLLRFHFCIQCSFYLGKPHFKWTIDIIQINFKRKFGFVHLSRIYYRNFFEKILNKKEMKTFSAFSTCCIYQVNYDTVGPWLQVWLHPKIWKNRGITNFRFAILICRARAWVGSFHQLGWKFFCMVLESRTYCTNN